MADLADKIDDLICSFEGGGDSTMDTVAMLVFGWAVLALFVLAIAKYVYARFIRKVPVSSESVASTEVVPVKKTESAVTDGKVEPKAVVATVSKPAASRGGGGKFIPPTPPLRKRLTAKKGSGPAPIGSRGATLVPPPTATGPDNEAVRWVTELLGWLYTDETALSQAVDVWICTLNELAKKSVEEVSGYHSFFSQGHQAEIY